MFDVPVKQYMMFASFEQAVKDREVAGIPNRFVDDHGCLNKHAQAYFGLFKQLFNSNNDDNANESSSLAQKGLDDDKLVAYAFEIDEVVNTAVSDYSINPAEIENAISVKLLPMLFVDLGVEKAQQLIEAVLKLIRLGLSRKTSGPKDSRR